ncbi:hypothetical protein K5D56_26225 [Pseudomonas cichorii]|nr:hypothetical protein [Pseudomonas cichorii]MBX8557010.1 hypothetical protein [Pseudomonas cichorii]MBX8592875.1 hypothetical protein [Pseudomonas cichorii]
MKVQHHTIKAELSRILQALSGLEDRPRSEQQRNYRRELTVIRTLGRLGVIEPELEQDLRRIAWRLVRHRSNGDRNFGRRKRANIKKVLTVPFNGTIIDSIED